MSQGESGPSGSGAGPDAVGSGGGERVGVVLSGAAARGPYQAGALAELLPGLRKQGVSTDRGAGHQFGGAHRGVVRAVRR